jgi:GNAT superfamily N-acetyltransferase
MHTIAPLDPQTPPSPNDLQDLSDTLIDCVAFGGGVSFLHPLSPASAHAFWQKAIASAQRGERVIFVARNTEGKIDGTVQLITDMPENQPHRGDVAKLLVHARARRQGLAERLMQSLEAHALQLNRWCLVLDTETQGGARRLYERLGWQRAGDVPCFALASLGGYSGTTFFYKHLRQPPALN